MSGMKTILKVLVALVVVAILLAGALAWRGQSILSHQWEIAIAPRTAPLAPPDLIEGKRIATIRGCLECHGADLGGQLLVQAPIGDLVPPNLTRGKGGVVAAYTPEDWERAIRHGVGPGGRPLILMPSDDNTVMSEADYAALLAYVQSVPPVDREHPPTRLTLLGQILLGAGQLPLLTAERIDHALRPAQPLAAPTVEYGEYVANMCAGCHGSNFAGGPIPGQPPQSPAAANLTPKGAIKDWTLAEFSAALRTGVRPDGRKMEPQYMPWSAFAAMTDTEVEALYQYLKSLPAADQRP